MKRVIVLAAVLGVAGCADSPVSPELDGWDPLFAIVPAADLDDVSNPETRADCKKGGWQDYGFRNQGQCIRFVNTGKDSRDLTSADTYTENFVDSNGINIELSQSSTGWEGGGEHTYYTGGSGIWVGPHVAVQPSGFNTPDGDTYFVSATSGGSSASKYAVTKAGESTIASAKRGSIVFTADFAANTNLGARFVAVVDGMWYASSQFGMADEDHGAMNQTEVTDWEVGVSANADTDNWYASLAGVPDGYVWRDGNQWDANPVAGGGLPVGDITQFGIAWLHAANHHYGAVDNFKWNE